MKVRINFLKSCMDLIVEADTSSCLEKNFRLSELANNLGDASLPQYEFNTGSILLVKMLQELRNQVRKPIAVNSGYRQKEYNDKIGGDKNSGHLYGWAVDISKISGISDETIAILWKRICLDNAQIGAINLYDTYYHLEIMSDRLYGAVNFQIRDHRNTKKGAKKC